MAIFKHENFILDLHRASKGKVYKDGKLLFIGDGYKAILVLLNNCENKEPVRTKFNSQLTMRETPKFASKEN